jgi:hypothetical protein
LWRSRCFWRWLQAWSRATAERSASEESIARGERSGWIPVHLEGSPAEIGFQHGYLLAPEIEDNFKVISTEIRATKRSLDVFPQGARKSSGRGSSRSTATS